MKQLKTKIPEVIVFEPTVYEDSRGYFMETFRCSQFSENGYDISFVQDNQSRSIKGTLRGLHYQVNYPQGKLVRVLSGEIFDVAVDLRKNSPTFGQWVGEILSSKNKKQLWIPAGFAHGFYVLSEEADIFYKCTEYYRQEYDRGLSWDDPDIGIRWPLLNRHPLISKKDSEASSFANAELYQ
ncbi:MAG: dTDP-4-dehydrorhamnose 3,5-epimerase [Gammaproteobacteria bacterium]|nr:dTDP-4-dehydrorhamnose 3,5-epimerase [Gammaproteobacteria bacterium]